MSFVGERIKRFSPTAFENDMNFIKKLIIKNVLNRFKNADYELEETLEKQWGGLGLVEYPKEGGILTYVKGNPVPFRGLLDKDIVNSVRVYKKILPMVIAQGWDSLHGYFRHPKFYCQSVREVYRVFSIMAEREQIWQLAERWRKIRDIACCILEFDDAYRFRFQDAMAELNVKEFELSEEDKYWFEPKPYDFKGKDEWIKQQKEKRKNNEEYDKNNKPK